MVEILEIKHGYIPVAIATALKIPQGGQEEFLKSYFPRKAKGIKRDNKAKTRRGFLADTLISLIECGSINFTTHHVNLFVLSYGAYCIILHRVVDGRSVRQEVIFEYHLTVTENNRLIISEADDDREYNDDGFRRPIMELFDLISSGKIRKTPISHVCGLMGFNPMKDKCKACDAERKHPVRGH